MQKNLINRIVISNLLLALIAVVAIFLLVPSCLELANESIDAIKGSGLKFQQQIGQFYALH